MRPKKNKHKKNAAFADGHDENESAPTDEHPEVADESDSDAEVAAETVDPMEQLKNEVAEWKDKFLRSKAEQQNIAKRSSNELSEALRYSGSSLLRSIVEVMDDLDRTVEAVGDGEASDTLTEGVRLVRDKLQKILTDHHVEVVDATGCAFDPSMHEALMQQPSADHEPGQVISQIQKGYRLHDRVLRPAKVIVSAATEAETTEAETDVNPDASVEA